MASAYDDDDPVVAEYDVFFSEELAEKVMLFQYPNRDRAQPLTEANHAKPLGLRMKPKAGMVEVDVPMNLYENFNREKAVRWGEAIRKSTAEKAGGSHGLAGGFGIGAALGSSNAGGSGPGRGLLGGNEQNLTQEMLLANFANANAHGHVLNKQTLAGQIELVTDEQPVYMIGVFHKSQVHLSRINSIVQLRPQFHHIDAMTEQERSTARGQRDAMNPPRQDARVVQMAVKTVDGDDFDMSQTMKTLKEIQEEKWRELEYMDENSPQAWEAFDKLFVKDIEDAPRLQSTMTNAEYLDAISAPKIEVTAAGRAAPLGEQPQTSNASNDAEIGTADDTDDEEEMPDAARALQIASESATTATASAPDATKSDPKALKSATKTTEPSGRPRRSVRR